MKHFHLVWSNLKRKKIRTTLTFLSIFIAFVLYGYMASVKQALSFGVEVAGADRLVVRHKVSIIQMLPESYEARIEQLDGVADATHLTWFGGVYQRPSNFFGQFPVNPDEYLAMYPEFLLPDDQMQAWRETRTGAVVGRGIADRYGFEIGDRVPLQATIWSKRDGGRTWEFDIVGIYDGAEKGVDDTQFLFRYDYFDEARVEGARGQVGWYIVQVADPGRAAEVASAIDNAFANSPAETKAETEGAFVQGFANQLANIGMITLAVLTAVFFTILLVAGNTMSQAVRERLNEIGVLKAVGYTHRQVLAMVLSESCLLAVTGGLAGLGVSWYLTSQGDPTGGALPLFFFPTRDLIIGVMLTVALGVAAGLLPAMQAWHVRVTDALRRK